MTKIVIHNTQTGEIIEREKNAAELAQEAKDLQIAQEMETAKAEAQAKRKAALSKLAALGLTADDLKALGL